MSELSAAATSRLTFSAREVPGELPEGACILATSKPNFRGAWIRSEQPRLDFAKALLVLDRLGRFEPATRPAEIHPSVIVSSGVTIGKNVVIGEGTRIEPNVTIKDDTTIGRECWLKSGSVIGEAGFGFARDVDGRPIRILHLGGLVIGDRVEIGSITTVCQGTLRPTVIEDDVKIDDHVHVGHNLRIKKRAIITACAELGGGVVIGEEAWVGPNAAIIERVQIGDRALVGLAAVVLRDVAADTTVAGNPARVLEKKAP